MKKRERLTTKRIVMISLFTALISIGAFIKIDTPAMSITLQFLFVVVAGLLLGKRDGVISVGVYIALGLIGLPIFARGGGVAYVVQPGFGYVLSFVVAAYICGSYSTRGGNPFLNMLMASFVALAVVYVIGTAYYWAMSTFYLGANIGVKSLFLYCVLLVLPGDILSCVIASVIARRLKNANLTQKM